MCMEYFLSLKNILLETFHFDPCTHILSRWSPAYIRKFLSIRIYQPWFWHSSKWTMKPTFLAVLAVGLNNMPSADFSTSSKTKGKIFGGDMPLHGSEGHRQFNSGQFQERHWLSLGQAWACGQDKLHRCNFARGCRIIWEIMTTFLHPVFFHE